MSLSVAAGSERFHHYQVLQILIQEVAAFDQADHVSKAVEFARTHFARKKQGLQYY